MFVKRVFSVLGLVLLAIVPSVAQDAIFRVLTSVGPATLVGAKSAAVSAGTKLYKDEVLTITEKSYVGLIHRSGRTLELKAPGTYKVQELDSKIMQQTKGTVSKRFSNYIFGEMTKTEEADLKKNHQQYMALTGAVVRAAGSRPHAIKPLIPATLAMPDRTYSLSWLRLPGKPIYVVTVMNMYDEPVLTRETTDTSLTIDFAQLPSLKAEKMCLVQVAAKGQPNVTSNQHALKFMGPAQAQPVLQEVAALTEADETAVRELALAMLFEQADLNLDALAAYRRATQLEPEVEEFRNQYLNFLVRTGLMQVQK